MAVKIRKLRGKFYLVIDHCGKRKTRVIGTDRKIAEEVRRHVEGQLALGDFGVFGSKEPATPKFGAYAEEWLQGYARLECKKSTADGYGAVLRQYLLPRFENTRLDGLDRADVKRMINDLIMKGLSRNTIRNVTCVLRGMFNHAIEAG